MSEFEEMLRKSLEQRKTKPLQAVNDLNAVVAELSKAVASVTGGRMKLFLDPLKPKPTQGPTHAVVLRFPDEDRILRVVMVWDEVGYPAFIWGTYSAWDLQENCTWQAQTVDELRAHLQGLVASPTSELVRLIANELAVAEAGSESALAG